MLLLATYRVLLTYYTRTYHTYHAYYTYYTFRYPRDSEEKLLRAFRTLDPDNKVRVRVTVRFTVTVTVRVNLPRVKRTGVMGHHARHGLTRRRLRVMPSRRDMKQGSSRTV